MIDFVCDDKGEKIFLEGNPGGAPANVLAMAAKLGLSTALVAKVGADGFGAFLRRNVEMSGVCTDFIKTDAGYPTTLAMVSLDQTGNRSFSFYRAQTADVMLNKDEIPYPEIKNCRILHFGSVSMTHQPAREATFAAARCAKDNGVIVSYDPNLRPPLWNSLEEAKAVILEGLSLADIVKLSEEELQFITGAASLEAGIESLFSRYALQLLVVTLGAKGCICRTAAGIFSDQAFDVPCVDTTGAGDAFWGASLSFILQREKPIKQYTAEEISEMLRFADAAGSLATTKKGAIPAMPTLQEIENCIKNAPRMWQSVAEA